MANNRVKRLPSGIIMVHDLTVNYDLSPAEAIEGLPNNESLITSDFNPARWNSRKSGIVSGDIPLYFPQCDFSTNTGRQGLVEQNLGYAVPANLVPISKDAEIRRALIDMGICYILALDKNDKKLWRDSVRFRRVVALNLDPDVLGFRLVYADDGWFYDGSVAGAPQVS